MKRITFFLLTLLLPLILSSSPLSHPLTLKECIELALEKNEDMLNAQANLRAAKANVLGAWSAFLPHLNSQASYSRSKNWSFPETRSYAIGFSLEQSIYNGGSNLANIKYQRANRRWYEEQLKLTKSLLVWEIKQKYYGLLRAKRLLQVRGDAVKRSEEQVKKAENLYRLGSVTISDVLKAKVQLGKDRLALIDAKNQLKQSRSELNHTLGLPLNSPTEIVDDLEKIGEEADYGKLIKQALETHPEILKAEAEMNKAEGTLSMAKGGRLPRLTLSGSYSWENEKASEAKNLFDRDYTWRIGGTVTLPLFDGLSTKANINQAKEGLVNARLRLKQTKRKVQLDIQEALQNLNKAQESLEVTKESLSAAREDLRLAQEKYKLGSVTMLEVLDAQASYSSIQAGWIEALYAYRLAQAEVEKALGLSSY